MGGGGTIRAGQGSAEQRGGKASLAFDYEIQARKFSAAILATEPGSLAAMTQVHFWVKTDYPTSVAVVLSEKGGGNYTALFWSPGNMWQEARLEARDFALGERPNDPPDPDGKLDLDQVHGIGVADLGQLFGGAPLNPAMPIVTARNPGKHTLLINSFELLSDASAHGDKLSIDTFDSPQLNWSTPGGATFRLDTSRQHAPGPALEVSYGEVDHAIVFFMRTLPPEIPANATHMSFDIASEKPAQLVFALQLKGSGKGEGPRYNTSVEIRGGGKTDHRDLALSALTLDQNGPADSGKEFSISRGKTLLIGDVSMLTNSAHGPNKLWISNLRFTGAQ